MSYLVAATLLMMHYQVWKSRVFVSCTLKDQMLAPRLRSHIFINVSIGTPLVNEQYMVLDTGSFVCWVVGNSTNKSHTTYNATKSLNILQGHLF